MIGAGLAVLPRVVAFYVASQFTGVNCAREGGTQSLVDEHAAP